MTLAPLELLRSEPPAQRPVISLSEGSDPRVIAGSLSAVEADVADVILVGDSDAVHAGLAAVGAEESDRVKVHDPASSPLSDAFAEAFHTLRRHKGVDEAAARSAVETPLVYAAMLVREGHAAGTVGGAVHTTSDVVRTALQVIGKAADAPIVSSFFLMYPPDAAPDGARAMLYSDSGLVIDPSAEELVAIAAASAASCKALLRTDPKIAMLSFSTKGSARHAKVSKVTDALAMLREKHPDLSADGELQFDAAFVPSVGASKAPGLGGGGAGQCDDLPQSRCGQYRLQDHPASGGLCRDRPDPAGAGQARQ